MVKVKMLVQTTYNNEILREGKIYQIAHATAQRWHASNIAVILEADE